jgi:acyl-CoA reductase-like NAD-dependent aldehyde dehydrogenase
MIETVSMGLENVPLWIDGEEKVSENSIDVTSPLTGEVIWTASSVSIEQTRHVIEAAQRAFSGWSESSIATRRTILLRAADLIDERRDILSRYMEQESGATAPFVAFNVSTAAELCRDVAGRVATISGYIPLTASPGTSALVLKEPLGVCLGIAPWNAPYVLGLRSFLSAIATGNTVIVKGPELSPRTYWALASIFHDAGLPAGVINVIYHNTEDAAKITDFLIEHPAIKSINFTGSSKVGALIAAKAGKELKPVLLELGGKASAIVCEDADLQLAAKEAAVGAFLHAGQICMSTERILVHKAVKHDFVEALRLAIQHVYPPTGAAPVLVNKAAVERNAKLVADAKSRGAEIITVEDAHSPKHSKYQFRPTIVDGVHDTMEIYHTESFGPTVSLIVVESDQEAISIANDTEYGLSGAVFTKDLGRGIRIAKCIESGAIHINSMSVQ